MKLFVASSSIVTSYLTFSENMFKQSIEMNRKEVSFINHVYISSNKLFMDIFIKWYIYLSKHIRMPFFWSLSNLNHKLHKVDIKEIQMLWQFLFCKMFSRLRFFIKKVLIPFLSYTKRLYYRFGHVKRFHVWIFILYKLRIIHINIYLFTI